MYFEQHIDLTRTLPWIEAQREKGVTSRATLFHLILHSLASTLHERERLNRFTVGRRTFQRKDVFLSFAAKKKMSDDAPLATIKRKFARDETLAQLAQDLSGEITEARADKQSAMDKELRVLLAFPGFILGWMIALLRGLYAIGLAPRKLVDTDPLYTSAFVVNLGSLKIDAAYHHLYEHGNCPLFMTIGQVTQVPFVVSDGDGDRVVARPQLTLRYTFDERVEDGLYCAKSLQLLAKRIEDPASWIG